MITKKRSHRNASPWFAGALVFVLAFFVEADEKKPIEMGVVGWADAEITSKLAKVILEDQLNQPVKFVSADIGIQFQALASGKVDMIPMAWLTFSHKSFWDRYKDRLEDLGVIYEGRLGLAVSTSIPESEVSSIADLNKPEVREKFGGKILTSEVGNGQYKMATKAIEDYKLNGYKLVASSEIGMLKEYDRYIKRDQWALLNAWSPHWMFSTWSMRYLDDPKESYGMAEQIHGVGRKGFSQDFPQAATFFANYKIPLKDLESMMKEARESSADKVVADYYAAHKATFSAMVKGSVTASGQ